MIDLHTHSTCSDGKMTPSELVNRAAILGITALALTDHDTIAGNAEAEEVAVKNDIKFAPGIELSCKFKDSEIHLLGYWIDSANLNLRNALSEIIEWRDKRNSEIINRLNRSGIPINLDKVRRIAGEGVLGRPHIGEVLKQMGYVSSVNEAFSKYLNLGGSAYVPRKKLSVQQGIDLIHGAGGINSLAHPGEYVFTHDGRFQSSIKELIELGLDGIEVYYPRHSAGDTTLFLETAEKYNMGITGGTDFHGFEGEMEVEIGTGIKGNMHLSERIFDRLQLKHSQIIIN